MSETTGCAISLLLTDDKSILNTPRAEDFGPIRIGVGLLKVSGESGAREGAESALWKGEVQLPSSASALTWFFTHFELENSNLAPLPGMEDFLHTSAGCHGTLNSVGQYFRQHYHSRRRSGGTKRS
jgi:hypothetical protein